MTGKIASAGAAALLLLALGALSPGREIEERSLITALAADRAEGGVTVTALTGVRATGEEQPQTLTGAGADMGAACRAVQRVQATRAYLGQADKLLLGEALAQDGLMDTLTFVLDHRELRLDTLLYIVKGNAGEGLAATAPSTAGQTPGRDSRGGLGGPGPLPPVRWGAGRRPRPGSRRDGAAGPGGLRPSDLRRPVRLRL